MFDFEITIEDVESDDTVNNLHEELDWDAIEKLVMYETDLDKQAEVAFEEIDRQISKIKDNYQKNQLIFFKTNI